MTTQIIAELNVEGFHNYPEAPGVVGFLQDRHRHTFRIICRYEVTDLNREKEIFLCRDDIQAYVTNLYGSPCEFGHMSCEMIAKEILEHFQTEGMNEVEVWEEHTGGAIVKI